MKAFKFLFLLFALLLATVFAAGIYADQQRRAVLARSLPNQQALVYQLPQGTSAYAVASDLQQRGWVADQRWLRWQFRLFPSDGRLIAGEYRIEPGMSVAEFLELLRSGDVIRYQATLVEGTTWRQSLQALNENPDLVRKLDISKPLWSQLALEPQIEHPEGQFFPDTYQFVRGDTDIDIFRRAWQRMQKVLEEEWQNREEGLPYASAYEALIMASIVERETGQPHERPEIAGVFVRRLQKKMKLQTDPTIIYGLGDAYQGNITRKHLRDDTNPYNTYHIPALPPTPIALPGRAAINAALHPAPGKTLYFVARGDGSHVFSETLAQHEKAVHEYQIKNRRRNYRSAPAVRKP